MSLKRDLRLIKAAMCNHHMIGGDLGQPRFCMKCDYGYWRRFDNRVEILRDYMKGLTDDH